MREVAAQRGCVIVRPKKNEIQLDIDDELSLNCFEARWSRIATNFNFTGQVSRKPSPSGRPGRWHITVTLSRNVSEHERILLQACLGSDPVRELLNLVHLQKGEISTLFFEKAVTEGSEDPPHETFYEELAKE